MTAIEYFETVPELGSYYRQQPLLWTQLRQQSDFLSIFIVGLYEI